MFCPTCHSVCPVCLHLKAQLSAPLAQRRPLDSVMADSRAQQTDVFTLVKMNLDVDRLTEYIDRNILTIRVSITWDVISSKGDYFSIHFCAVFALYRWSLWNRRSLSEHSPGNQTYSMSTDDKGHFLLYRPPNSTKSTKYLNRLFGRMSNFEEE